MGENQDSTEMWISDDQTESEDLLHKESLSLVTRTSILKVLCFSLGGLTAGVSEHPESVVWVVQISGDFGWLRIMGLVHITHHTSLQDGEIYF